MNLELLNHLDFNKLSNNAHVFFYAKNGTELVSETEASYFVLSTETSAALYNLTEFSEGISGFF